MSHDPGSLVGTTVGGIYKMRRLIGSGGMGEVYAAEGKSGQKVAIKVLHDRAARDKDLLARFHREASIAAQIKSPHIAAILGAGRDPDGRPWIAFELLSGEGLDERLRREQYLSFSDIAPIVDDALQGLAAAHKAGVIHRDIKPANLFIEKRRLSAREIANDESDERTRILDFGVSKVRPPKGQHKSEPSLTAYDATLGSFAYMAPEQVRGSARVDVRADLYALGAVAFRALSGRLPFEGQNALTLIALKLDREPPTLSATTGDEWPGSIERFLAKMMARDRERRFASATEALSTWRRVCRQMGDRPHRRPRSLPTLRDDERGDTTAPTFTGSVSKVGRL
jgi:serine/threonine-protein kinase